MTAAGSDSKKKMLINSTVAFVCAGIVAVTLHELAHLLAGLMLGYGSTFYPSAVNPLAEPSTQHQMVIAAAGPLFSIVSGLLVVLYGRNWGKGFYRLLAMWFGYLSAQVGFGYCIVAGVMGVGDTAQVLRLMHASWLWYGLVFVFGVGGMLFLARSIAREAVRYCGMDVGMLRNFGLYTWLIGTGVLTALYVYPDSQLPPEAAGATIAASLTIGVFTPLLTFFYKKVTTKPEPLALGAPTQGYLSLLALIAVVLLAAKGVVVG